MELIETKKVKIGNIEIPIRYSNRAMLAYLNSAEKEKDNLKLAVEFFYQLAKTGARVEGKDFKYTLEEFWDLIDPYPEAIPNFYEAVSDIIGPGGDEKKQEESSK